MKFRFSPLKGQLMVCDEPLCTFELDPGLESHSMTLLAE